MLEEVLRYLQNWFVVPDGIHTGTFAVEGGSITLPFLQPGQYFRIIGSVFNDGLYRYGPDMEALQDETFEGAVWALAVPKAVFNLSNEIAEWHVKNGFIVTNPYVAESFGGYSVTYRTDISGWRDVFRSRLSQWRKL